MSFVGYKQVNSVDELKELITQYTAQSPSYYFLRWAHRVSGIETKLPQEFPRPEGQVFNSALELRWKRQRNGYSVLLLKGTSSDVAEGFTEIPGDWETCDRAAHFHSKTDARFPKGFTYPNNLSIHQRYFFNVKTATVHFIALTINPSS
ncbi:MAG: hypothetical protein HC851_06755 [Acaryochloris sp. RU_4_1]|nr:hypothetical protein [Leptolyngbyaceae cyanobacterium SU_3_3]NJM65381.1 hypothetical protein [Acaryochloris sp. RU_4_1]NJR54082.1 hypothetical protein [Acaryochloris sp. CRU_2_0]